MISARAAGAWRYAAWRLPVATDLIELLLARVVRPVRHKSPNSMSSRSHRRARRARSRGLSSLDWGHSHYRGVRRPGPGWRLRAQFRMRKRPDAVQLHLLKLPGAADAPESSARYRRVGRLDTSGVARRVLLDPTFSEQLA